MARRSRAELLKLASECLETAELLRDSVRLAPGADVATSRLQRLARAKQLEMENWEKQTKEEAERLKLEKQDLKRKREMVEAEEEHLKRCHSTYLQAHHQAQWATMSATDLQQMCAAQQQEIARLQSVTSAAQHEAATARYNYGRVYEEMQGSKREVQRLREENRILMQQREAAHATYEEELKKAKARIQQEHVTQYVDMDTLHRARYHDLEQKLAAEKRRNAFLPM